MTGEDREAENGPGADIEQLDFETAMRELGDIVRRLEGGDVALEESISIYERGALLKRHCETKLRAATEKVERLIVGRDGDIGGAEPADIE